MHQIQELIADSSLTVREVLKIIEINSRGVCFVISYNKLVGVVTDGDIRRALIRGLGLDAPITEVMNKEFISLDVHAGDRLIRNTFSASIKLIPLCDSEGALVDVADALRTHRIPVLEPYLGGRESDYVLDCIQSNWISSQGAYVRRFEEQFEKMHPGMHAVAVSNGTTALHLGLAALGIGPGDEVIVPNITFAATINAVLYCQATPVLCEIDAETWCIDVDEARSLVTQKTKAIIPVHLYGQPCNMDQLLKLSIESDIYIVEDCAEAIGTEYGLRPVGGFGDVATFSFFGNKTISTGEGGMVLFKGFDMAEKARMLRDHGMSRGKRYWHEEVGFNYRLTNLQAAVGVAQMERLDLIVQKKIKIASLYGKFLFGVKGIEKFPVHIPNAKHSNWLYTVLLDSSIDRDLVIKDFLNHGIETRPVFFPLNIMPPYKNYRTSRSLKNSFAIASTGISLPSSTNISEEEVKYVSLVFKNILSGVFG